MLKILQVRLQQYMNWELPDVWAGFRKGRGTRDQIANIRWIIQKARESRNIYFCFINYAKSLTVWITTNSVKFLKMGILNHLTCFLWNLYAGQEAIVRTKHGTKNWSKIGKGLCQGCILSPCLISLQSTSCEMPGWVTHKLESRLQAEISPSSDLQMTTL